MLIRYVAVGLSLSGQLICAAAAAAAAAGGYGRCTRARGGSFSLMGIGACARARKGASLLLPSGATMVERGVRERTCVPRATSQPEKRGPAAGEEREERERDLSRPFRGIAY